MPNNDLTLALTIKTLVEGSPNVKALSDELKKLGIVAGQPVADPTAKMRPQVQKTTGVVSDLSAELARLASAGSIALFVRESLAAMTKAEAGFKGLESVSNYVGVSLKDSWAVVTRFTADGLVSMTDASKALQNLLSRGYDISQAENTLNRLKDSAAFNRQASLSLSEAVVSATEGLKNENSILVDNAGVTKNVSKMWEDYAKKIGVGVQTLSQAQKIQAEYDGIMHETEAQLGNAAKAADGYQGSIAKLGQSFDKLKASFGGDLAEGAGFLSDVLRGVVGLAQEAGVELNKMGIEVSYFFQQIQAIKDNHSFSALLAEWQRNYAVMEEMEAKVEERYRDGLTPAMQDAAQAAAKSGLAVASAAKQSADAETRIATAMQANAEKLKLITTQVDAQYARQNVIIANALQTRLAVIDASNANETVREQQKAEAEAQADQAKLAALRVYQSERLAAINDAYNKELIANAQSESQKKQISLESIAARKDAYGDLAKAYQSVVDAIQGQWMREMDLYRKGTQSIEELGRAHEAQVLEISRSAMSERDKLKSEEKERDDAIAKLKAEQAKGEKADLNEVNRLYDVASKLVQNVSAEKAKGYQTESDKAYEAKKAVNTINGLWTDQEKVLKEINAQHKDNADKLTPSLNDAKTKLSEINGQLETLDKQFAQAKQLKIEVDKDSFDAAKKALGDLTATETKTIVVKTVAAGSEAAAAAPTAPAPDRGKDEQNSILADNSGITVDAEGHRWGGLIRALASGGRLPGYGGGDKIPLLGEGGEFMVRKESVQKYGVPLFEALNAGKFASGGMVGDGQSQAYGAEFKTLLDSLMSPIEETAGLNAWNMDFNAQPVMARMKTRIDSFINAAPASVQQSLRDMLNNAMQGRIAGVLMGEKSLIAEQHRPGSAETASAQAGTGEKMIGVFRSMMAGGAGINRDAINRQIDVMTNHGKTMPAAGQAWLDMAMQAVAAAKESPPNPLFAKGGADAGTQLQQALQQAVGAATMPGGEPPFANPSNPPLQKVGRGDFTGGGFPSSGVPLQPIQINSPQSGKAATVYGAPSDHKELVDLLKFHAMTT